MVWLGLPRDHPRLRGEHPDPTNERNWKGGSSPPARGALDADRGLIRILRIIPACAGSTRHELGIDLVD